MKLKNDFPKWRETHASIFPYDQREWLVKPTVVTLAVEQRRTESVQLGVIILMHSNLKN
jgi:hypothetical protein